MRISIADLARQLERKLAPIYLLYGEEPHHVAEALFKAFAKAVDSACQRDPRAPGQLPTTKGRL